MLSPLQMNEPMMEAFAREFTVHTSDDGKPDTPFGGYTYVWLNWNMSINHENTSPNSIISELISAKKNYILENSLDNYSPSASYRIVLLSNLSWYIQNGIGTISDIKKMVNDACINLAPNTVFEFIATNDLPQPLVFPGTEDRSRIFKFRVEPLLHDI